MGASDSKMKPVTPSRLRNQHLIHVLDPRSPSVGIPRTPIEVLETPPRSLTAVQEEEVTESPLVNDPRSPTQGIVRTPLRSSIHASLNLLAKQLSEVFLSEDSGIEGSLAANKEAPAETPDVHPMTDILPPPAEKTKEPEAVQGPAMSPLVAAETTLPMENQQRSRGKSPRAAGTKNIRHRPRKALVSSAHGRSPLKILQEDNSPSTAVQNRQIKKILLQSEQPSALSPLKISHCGWEMSQDKENAHYIQSES
ncbi:cell division cycle-associated protein 3 [Leptodactylus fuscus]|uniref:cell division cycle-associated protein 3 n=1 Tax=Leptodactylus fuscus TaxID=238119 RepID=UPI003F4EE68D